MKESPSSKTVLTKQLESNRTDFFKELSIEDCEIQVIEGPHKGLVLPLHRELTLLGRGEWCGLILADDILVSKEHAELQWTESGLLVRDLDSRNSTFVQGMRVLSCFLEPGAELRVGNSVLVLRTKKQQRSLELQYFDESHQLLGKSAKMRRIFSLLPRLAARAVPLLLLGETGTGKSSIARALHEQGPRKDGPFVVINCGALSASLIEGMLFGYEKGAFTGATRSHKGYFAQADGGTLFLDEIGELPLELQPKLLDVLERQCIRPLGGTEEHPVDVYVLSATHRDLQRDVRERAFRQDLYFRLAVVELKVPALRERLEDLELLTNSFLREIDAEGTFHLSPSARRRLYDYAWPGNVRQLFNVLKRSIALFEHPHQASEALLFLEAEDIILPEFDTLPELPHSKGAISSPTPQDEGAQGQLEALLSADGSLKDWLEKMERHLIVRELKRHYWRIQETADALGISRVWLYKRMKKYDLRVP